MQSSLFLTWLIEGWFGSRKRKQIWETLWEVESDNHKEMAPREDGSLASAGCKPGQLPAQWSSWCRLCAAWVSLSKTQVLKLVGRRVVMSASSRSYSNHFVRSH